MCNLCNFGFLELNWANQTQNKFRNKNHFAHFPSQKSVPRDTVPEIIDSGPMCITDLCQNKSVAYLNPK